MPRDINDFRVEKGGNLEKVLEDHRKRGKPEEQVHEVVRLDQNWRQANFQIEQLRKEMGAASKQVGQLKKSGQHDEAKALMDENILKKDEEKRLSEIATTLEKQLRQKLSLIGNEVHPSVPVSNTEDDNKIEKVFGECKSIPNVLNHHEVLHMIDGYESQKGIDIAGHRAYFLKGVGVRLNMALQMYGVDFLSKRNYTPLQPPFFMRKEIMAETAQLEEFDESLYHVEDGKEEDMYLIATSEQPISAFHRGDWLGSEDLPKRYAGISTCFRKEAGSHGRDTWGIFRVHQFEKIEQFCITDPEKSWEMQDEMLQAAEEFYQSLGLSYRVVNIVSGALNNAAARKLDLEAWFPGQGEYRELVSCSNCTDYQARAMETRFGKSAVAKNMERREKKYVHMLNATLCATERTICCLIENYQTPTGVVVPEVLRPYMGGLEFIPFVKEKPVNVNKLKTEKGQKKKEDAPASA